MPEYEVMQPVRTGGKHHQPGATVTMAATAARFLVAAGALRLLDRDTVEPEVIEPVQAETSGEPDGEVIDAQALDPVETAPEAASVPVPAPKAKAKK